MDVLIYVGPFVRKNNNKEALEYTLRENGIENKYTMRESKGDIQKNRLEVGMFCDYRVKDLSQSDAEKLVGIINNKDNYCAKIK